jgi:hypothetical protein
LRFQIQKPCGLQICLFLLQTTFVPQLFKILGPCSNHASIKNFHSRVKTLGWPTKRHGTFSGRKLLADCKKVHALYAWRSILTLAVKKM